MPGVGGTCTQRCLLHGVHINHLLDTFWDCTVYSETRFIRTTVVPLAQSWSSLEDFRIQTAPQFCRRRNNGEVESKNHTSCVPHQPFFGCTHGGPHSAQEEKDAEVLISRCAVKRLNRFGDEEVR